MLSSFILKSCVCLQLVLDSQKRVFSWGFGGYGRLGHTEQKDEMVPRLVKLFDFPGRGATQIYTGYQCSLAVSEMGEIPVNLMSDFKNRNSHRFYQESKSFI